MLLGPQDGHSNGSEVILVDAHYTSKAINSVNAGLIDPHLVFVRTLFTSTIAAAVLVDWHYQAKSVYVEGSNCFSLHFSQLRHFYSEDVVDVLISDDLVHLD
jgi:hypothetical protein